MTTLADHFTAPGRVFIAGAPEGRDALAFAELRAALPHGDFLFIARDESRMVAMAETLALLAPDARPLLFPAWDCLPYDRVSPKSEVCARRLHTLITLADADGRRRTAGNIVLTTCNAALQRVPRRAVLAGAHFAARVGERLDREALLDFLNRNGYVRAGTVMEPGDYTVRGGIIDLFPAGAGDPIRLDLFGDVIDSVRSFEPLSQRSTTRHDGFDLIPGSEVLLDDRAIARFRGRYRELFGAVTGADPLYESVSAGRRHPGMEHWLALFHDGLETLFAYLPEAAVLLDHLLDEVREARLAEIEDHYAARIEGMDRRSPMAGPPYKPAPPEDLFLSVDEWARALAARPVGAFSPFPAPPSADGAVVDLGARRGRDFAPERKRKDASLFAAVGDHIRANGHRRLVIACESPGSRARLSALLREHDIDRTALVDRWAEVDRLAPGAVALVVWRLPSGFETDRLVVLGEQDILGDRLARRPRRARRAANYLSEASSLEPDDIVVHVDHGIGRFAGLETITVAGAPHDCVKLLYAGDDRLYVPVENIEMLGRYGAGEAEVQLDQLGGSAWQARKSKLKARLRDMAQELIATAAERALRTGAKMTRPAGLFDEFCARFPYPETDDQLNAIDESLDDLAAGAPMDRLICGDVGFGKTEIALRAAFVAAFSGRQTAIVAPTTLLCRQHYETFTERFAGFPVTIAQLSRLVPAKTAAEVRRDLAGGGIDIVIGTHALLGRSVTFKRLGLLIIDEEQHFGVAQKERLKALRSDAHVLTLTATPIPRTLQLALSGVRALSLIATPPIDRLAVRSFVTPYDPVVIREAIKREHYRGGQIFYVCPRIEDLGEVAAELRQLVPEIKFIVAHGRMPARRLDEAMTAFYDGTYDLLLSTSIIESGLDLPSVNTLIVHRADRFGLAQLYQLRGRVGRSKIRAYAYFTVPPQRLLDGRALKRLEVIQRLDSLGAGFSLASHDLDIRGAGNLLGEEQSGHIREVGVELYQQMLSEAVQVARGAGARAGDERWSPRIEIGAAVLLPADYVADLGVRLGLYRRLADLDEGEEIDRFAAELVDRFGPLPREVEHLLKVVRIKQLCRRAGIESIDAGPKGAVLGFRDNDFAAPERLLEFILAHADSMRLRPDHRLVVTAPWADENARLAGVAELAQRLAAMVG